MELHCPNCEGMTAFVQIQARDAYSVLLSLHLIEDHDKYKMERYKMFPNGRLGPFRATLEQQLEPYLGGEPITEAVS